MKDHSTVFLLTAGLCAAVTSAAFGADSSTERTSMPDYCSNRGVNCVIPDGPPVVRGRAGIVTGSSPVITPPVGGSSSGTATAIPTVPSVPALPAQVPSLFGQAPGLPAQVPSLFGQVPTLPAQVPSATSGTTSTGTTSSSTGATGTAAATGSGRMSGPAGGPGAFAGSAPGGTGGSAPGGGFGSR